MPCFASALILLLAGQPTRADLPVHCVRHQVVGEWHFILGPASETRSSCGHSRPDMAQKQPAREALDKQGGETQLTVTLKNPNVAVSAKKTGTWTMIYDEGFEVNVEGLNFFAFSNYTFTNGIIAKNVSHCGDTMVGWYQNAGRTKFGCYYGRKTDGASSHVVHPTLLAKKDKPATYNHELDKKAQKKVVNRLNLMQTGWTAREMPKWNGRTLRDVNQYAGIQRDSRSRQLHKEMLLQHAQPRAKMFLQQNLVELPEAFDWTKVNGKNYLQPVMDQGDCGSCYAVSSVNMLSARHRIKQKDPEAEGFSINVPLFCAEYNQGCDGGYGILATKWSGDVGLLPASCMQYNTSGSCSLDCDLHAMKGKRFRAANHRYVGSWYGNSSEEAMKRELYANGPITLGLEPAEDFMFYGGGVYRSVMSESTSDGEWEKVDHAVLLVGWGVDAGDKYWRVQNSWGDDWGEDGYFRIARGEGESAIESIPEAADVLEDDQNGNQMTAFFQQMTSTVGAVRKHA